VLARVTKRLILRPIRTLGGCPRNSQRFCGP
jgi:hypothetical protein